MALDANVTYDEFLLYKVSDALITLSPPRALPDSEVLSNQFVHRDIYFVPASAMALDANVSYKLLLYKVGDTLVFWVSHPKALPDLEVL